MVLALSVIPPGLLAPLEELGGVESEGEPAMLKPGTTVEPTDGGKSVPVAVTVGMPTLIPNELPPYQTTVLPFVIVVGLDCQGYTIDVCVV